MTGLKRSVAAFLVPVTAVVGPSLAKSQIPPADHWAAGLISGVFAVLMLWCNSPTQGSPK